MNRQHTIEEYLNIIDKLKKVNPSIQFSSDFIIGFPGESDRDFKDSLELVKKVKFINSYSFIFSPRPGTPAFQLEKIDEKISKERLIIFQNFCEEIKLKYRKELLKKSSNVLFENRVGKKNEFFGRDMFSNSVITKSEKDLTGEIIEIKILSGNQNTLFGKICNESLKKEYAA